MTENKKNDSSIWQVITGVFDVIAIITIIEAKKAYIFIIYPVALIALIVFYIKKKENPRKARKGLVLFTLLYVAASVLIVFVLFPMITPKLPPDNNGGQPTKPITETETERPQPNWTYKATQEIVTPTPPHVNDKPEITDIPVAYILRQYILPEGSDSKANRKESKFIVRSGPGENYRSFDGVYVSAGEEITVYGSEGDWILVQYESTDTSWRRGYISKDALPTGTEIKGLHAASIKVVVTSDCAVTDDPAYSLNNIATLNKGTAVDYLLMDGMWAFIEFSTKMGLMRGFVKVDSLSIK